MKNLRRAIIGPAILLAFTHTAIAVVDQQLQLQGTNLVLSWPSQGYEYYMIEYRPTLDPSTPWQQLTNAYRANSTNRTTYIVPCCALVALGGESGVASFSAGVESSASMLTTSFEESFESNPFAGWWAMPADGSGSPVPLSIYPPGFDTNGLLIFDQSQMQMLSQALPESGGQLDGSGASDSPVPLGIRNGGCDCPDTGFFSVFYIPDWAIDITSYTYDGPTFIPVDFKGQRDRIDNIEVLLDGETTPYAEYLSLFYNNQTNWGMGIYFDRLANGIHQIQLRSTLRLNDEIGDNTVYLALSNLTASITVTNQVMFPDWNPLIQGDTYTFKAQTANPDTDWAIDIYDAWYAYVNSGSGHTVNGQISWTWDLTDWTGNSRDGDLDSDPWFYGEITYTPLAPSGNGPGSGPVTASTPVLPKGYPDVGQWLVAYQDRWFSDAPIYPPDCQEKYTNAMVLIAGGPILKGDPATLYPIKFGTNVYSQTQRNASWTNLLTLMGNPYIRNFYYCGHGSANSIGCDKHVLSNGVPVSGDLTSTDSKSYLRSWQVKQSVMLSPYRFAFLDGCSTAAGDWPTAFGMNKATHDIPYFQNQTNHPRPYVFIGWNEVPTTKGGTDVYKWLDFEANWMGIWANNLPLFDIRTSLEAADLTYNWLPIGDFRAKIRYYGYQYMTIRDYNRKSDWRWP